MARRDMIVIGGSAGSIEVMLTLAAGLPADLPAAICVVIHLSVESAHALPRLLQRKSALGAAAAADGQTIEHGRIYLAPPDHHLLVRKGHIHVVRGPREHRHRPAIDPLFHSAAVAYGPRVIGLILSGTLDDGSAGLRAVKRCGGIAVVQDPNDALFASMPENARNYTEVDHCVAADRMAELIMGLVAEDIGEPADPPPAELLLEARMAEDLMTTMSSEEKLGELMPLSCPECGGTLWQIEDEIPRYRCHLGHAYTADHLLQGQTEAVEQALWAALRALKERVETMSRLARRMHARGHPRIASRYEGHVREAGQHAQVISRILLENGKRFDSLHAFD